MDASLSAAETEAGPAQECGPAIVLLDELNCLNLVSRVKKEDIRKNICQGLRLKR